MNRDSNVNVVRTYKVSLYDKDGGLVEEVTVRGRPVTPFARGFAMATLRPDEDLTVRVEVVD